MMLIEGSFRETLDSQGTSYTLNFFDDSALPFSKL